MLRKIGKLFFVSLMLCFFQSSYAHGTMEVPISRVYSCYKEGPENPKSAACKAAVVAGGTQALYDWNGINQGAANGNHQAVIKDGTLCAGGRDLFKGMNLPRADWTATPIMPNSTGNFQFTWYATAPHAIRYFRFYMTKDSYDFTQPLKWSDLDTPFCTVTSASVSNGRYKLNCPLPNKSGRRIIFAIWQRSDSAEAFYSCSDVIMSGSSGGTPTTTWKELGGLYGNTDLAVDTKVSFRLFNNNTEAERYSVQVISGQTSANDWPYYLAQEVNAKSALVHIGQLDAATGNIIPVRSSSLNKVYVSDANTSTYGFNVDFILPSEDFDYVYPDGIASYVAGTKVLGSDKRRYQCKAWPYSAWCKGPASYYAPGKGISWQSAWDVLP